MYDTIHLKLTSADADGSAVDFMGEVPCYLDEVAEHNFGGREVISGNLGNLKVTITPFQVKVMNSLPKFFYGDNFSILSRSDTERAIEKLSDALHLPMKEAVVTRLDVAQNLVMHSPAIDYFNALGELKGYTRVPMVEVGTLYYNRPDAQLYFYDKNREAKAHREQIPDLYQGRNVVRYELRCKRRLGRIFNVAEVKASMLYAEDFYMSVCKMWRDSFLKIAKVNKASINFQAMTTKQDLYKMAVLVMVKECGGEVAFLSELNQARERGQLSAKQAYDLRQAVKGACALKAGLTIPNEAAIELEKKVREAVRFYR